ncbi:transglycosylase SLT domain-containing protein [Sphaerisporangium sp. TRM90804]|uniref:aggregation-promoting factor C-terminal-like domain-containing protein n=1 Tax=Sphaerisporangium sp. TRM90804 TaxID=3031113 RepID=UPI00244C37F2|nr:transglycosylase SLT domain-containing protein [Sphaerisporangium sp. TRM90804]MDH2428827.1 transglycosylase SLT domain-containing protein [Sphaerisporangium sp. TRM90804]
MTPKRMTITGLSVALVAASGFYVVRTAQENEAARKVAEAEAMTLPDLARMLDNPFAPDPETDALKAAAAQAQRAQAIKDARNGVPAFKRVKIVKKAPAGGGFAPADFPPGSRPNPGSNKALGQEMAAARGWAGEWGCLEKLWDKESNWNERAMNRSSGAYGIPQSLPGHKMASAGSDWQVNPATQIKWGLGYIAARYKSPCGAWAHSQRVGWY